MMPESAIRALLADCEAERQQRSAHEAAVNAIVCEADSWSLIVPTLRDLMWQVGQLASPGAAMYPQTVKQTLIVLGSLVLRWLEMEIAKEHDLD